MAGKVHLKVQQGTNPNLLYGIPQPCPVSNRLWSGLDCVVVDRAVAWVNLCPFLYGLQVRRGGCVMELRSEREILAHMAHSEYIAEEYTCLCLRKESAGTEAGARLRS